MGYHMNQVGAQPELWNAELAFVLIGVLLLMIVGTMFSSHMTASHVATK